MVVWKFRTKFVSLPNSPMINKIFGICEKGSTWCYIILFTVDGEMEMRKVKSGPLSEDGEIPPPGNLIK